MHPAERTVCCRLIRFSWYGPSCPGEILRISTVSLPEVQKKRGADVDFQAVWAHVSNQKLQVSPRGASGWWRESVRNSVSVHQDKTRGSAIECILCARKVRTWLPDRSLIIVRSYWGQILRIWDLTHLDEHCGKEASSTRQSTCEYHAGDPFGIILDQPFADPPILSSSTWNGMVPA